MAIMLLAVGLATPAVQAQGVQVTLAPVVQGLAQPTLVVGFPDGSGRLVVLERAGLLRIVRGETVLPEPFLDLRSRVAVRGTEQGLLGLAFAPDFTASGLFFVYYTGQDGTATLARYRVSTDAPDRADPATAEVVLRLPKQSLFHNGGSLAFGPDGDLYVGVGDDEQGVLAQRLDNLYGKILRIDVRSGAPYAIPAGNPFVGRADARPEVWAYGLRNPWRFSFDRATGDLWIGDVGEAQREEVDLQRAGTAGGQNYGWPILEGTLCYEASPCSTAGLTPPVIEYEHDMECAVVGGFAYRGSAIPALRGQYVFGDLCTGGIFGLRESASGDWTVTGLHFAPIKLSSFGEDPSGEIYVADIQGGAIYRLVDASAPPPPPAPRPEFRLGFAFLKQQLGDIMGDPVENELGNPDNCDTQQLTTTGLAYWRCSTNVMSFASLPDGLQHWAWVQGGLVHWTGPSPDPPAPGP